MSRRIVPQTLALLLVSCFVLCQPAILAAMTSAITTQQSQPQVTTAKTRLQPVAVIQPGSNEEKPKAAAAEKTIKKNTLRAKSKSSAKSTYLKSAKKTTKLTVNNHKHLGNAEDCNACHTNCLIAGLACIAISIATACPICGLICVGAQAACEGVCNTTTACQALNN